jgi:hypothetical protein
MAERVQPRELGDDEGQRLLRILRRGSGSVVEPGGEPLVGRRAALRADGCYGLADAVRTASGQQARTQPIAAGQVDNFGRTLQAGGHPARVVI